MLPRRNTKYAVTVLCGLACLSATTHAQTPEDLAKFLVAEIHPSPKFTNSDLSDMSGGLLPGGRYVLRRASMVDLIRTAYGVDAAKVLGGPSWLGVDRFDLRAMAPAGTTTVTVKPMLQAMLADRFGLVINKDTKPVSAWALTAGKHPQLKQSEGSGDAGCHADVHADGPGQIPLVDVTCHNMAMADFAAHILDMPAAWNFLGDNVIVDQTHLNGAWDFSFQYSKRDGDVTARAAFVSLFDSLEKIGLSLNPGDVSVPAIIVDQVSRTPTPNSPEAAKAFPAPPTEFEVAEVKLSDPDTHDTDVEVQKGGRVTVRGATLKWLVTEIWGITDEMLVAPKSMDTTRWDIVAKAPDIMSADGDPDIDALLAMVKTLLADRFKLAVHYEERPLSAYVLTAPKPKLKKADPNSRTGCKEGPPTLMKIDPRVTDPVLGRLFSCTNTTMAYLGEQMQYLASGYVHTPVLDSTGLEGGYDFTVNFSTARQFKGGMVPPPGAAASDPNGAITFPEAMEKQLGLKLELVKRPVAVLVVDHVEEKPTDN